MMDRSATLLFDRQVKGSAADCPLMSPNLLTQSDHQRQVGARLRRLLELMGMQQIEAAGLMGVSKQTLNNWLRGDSYPAPYPLYRLCRARGVDFNFIFLADWSALPGRVARELDAELSAATEPAPAADHQASET